MPPVTAEIDSLGPIQHAEVTLKPLTVFIGPNNTGKTWTAYTLAGLFDTAALKWFCGEYISSPGLSFPEIDTAFDDFRKCGRREIDIRDFMTRRFEEVMRGIRDLSPKWLAETLQSRNADFSDLKIRLEIDPKKAIDTAVKRPHRDIHDVESAGRRVLACSKPKNDRTLAFRIQGAGAISDPAPADDLLRKFFYYNLFYACFRNIHYTGIHYFPAERTAINVFPDTNTKPEPDPYLNVGHGELRESYPGAIIPVEKYTELVGRLLGEAEMDRNRGKSNFSEPAGLLETRILNSNIERDSIAKKIYMETESTNGDDEGAKSVKIFLNISSSMVKSLASLVLYLRYRAKKGDLLIIDEPENHLHPEAQVKMTELLAMLANAGLHVLVTTHSPYLVDHIVNLMKAGKIKSKEKREAAKAHFFLNDTRAFIKQRNVSVYLFDRGVTRDILKRNGMIDWDTFGNISESVEQIYFEM